MSHSVERRRARQEFIGRGLASAASARETGQYVPASRVMQKIAARLAKARKGG